MKRCFKFYPLTLLTFAVVTTLCLIPIQDPPMADVPFIDKWTHMVLFGGIAFVVLLERWINRRRLHCWTVGLAAALYGGAVEWMQANLTTCRSGEWMDFAADAVGAFAVSLIVWFLQHYNIIRTK